MFSKKIFLIFPLMFLIHPLLFSENISNITGDTSKPKMKEFTKEISIQKTDSKSVEIESENGVISKLVIDGKLIPKEDYSKYQKDIEAMKNSRERTISVSIDDDGETIIEEHSKEGKIERRTITQKKTDAPQMEITIEEDDNKGNSAPKRKIIKKRIDKDNNVITIETTGDDEKDAPEMHHDVDVKLQKELELVERGHPRHSDRNAPVKERIEKKYKIIVDGDGHRELQHLNHLGKVNSLDDYMEQKLIEDGYIQEGKKYRFELSSKNLKINKSKQPENIHDKYLKLYESFTNSKMNRESKYVLEQTPNHKKIIIIND